VLLIDYRGYGKSTGGPPSEQTLYEDAEAAWRFLIERKAVSAKRAVIYGHSLGGAVAIDLAARHPEAAALIVESTFTSMADVARTREYRLFPVYMLLTQRFESVDKARGLKMPTLLIHGTRDDIVPYRMSEALYEALSGPKLLQLIPEGDHGNNDLIAPMLYRQATSELMHLAGLDVAPVQKLPHSSSRSPK